MNVYCENPNHPEYSQEVLKKATALRRRKERVKRAEFFARQAFERSGLDTRQYCREKYQALKLQLQALERAVEKIDN